MSGQEIEPVKPVSPVEYYGDERATFDRLDGESVGEFQWFDAYRRLGRKRSYKEIAQCMEVRRERVQAVASKHSWVIRARAYDEFTDGQRLAELEGRQISVKIDNDRMLESAFEKLEAAISIFDPYKINPRDIPAWIDVLIKARRQSVGISDAPKKIEITGAGGGPIEVINSMTSGERGQLLGDMISELTRRADERAALEAASNIVDADIVSEDHDA